MQDDACRCSFFICFGIGGRSCSNLLASTVRSSSDTLLGYRQRAFHTEAEHSFAFTQAVTNLSEECLARERGHHFFAAQDLDHETVVAAHRNFEDCYQNESKGLHCTPSTSSPSSILPSNEFSIQAAVGFSWGHCLKEGGNSLREGPNLRAGSAHLLSPEPCKAYATSKERIKKPLNPE